MAQGHHDEGPQENQESHEETHPAVFAKAWSRAWTWKGGGISIPLAKGSVFDADSYRLYRRIALLSALRTIWRRCLRTKLLEARQYDRPRLLSAGPRGPHHYIHKLFIDQGIQRGRTRKEQQPHVSPTWRRLQNPTGDDDPQVEEARGDID